MQITMTCFCGRELQFPEEEAGERRRCSECGRGVTVPGWSRTYNGTRPEGIVALEEGTTKSLPLQRFSVEALDAIEEQLDQRTRSGPSRFLLSTDRDFFVEAPDDIGPVLGAYSSLREGEKEIPYFVQWAVTLALVAVGGVVGGFIAVITEGLLTQVAVIMTVLGYGLGDWLTRFRHECMYVGKKGIAKFRCSGSRDWIVEEEVFLFWQAVELFTTHNRIAGQPTPKKKVSFRWADPRGYLCFEIRGRHIPNAALLGESLFQFGLLVERVWSEAQLEDARNQLERAGLVEFRFADGDWICVGQNRLVAHYRDQHYEWEVSDIVNFNNGVLTLLRDGRAGSVHSPRGTVSFDVDELANAHLFYVLAERLLGLSAEW